MPPKKKQGQKLGLQTYSHTKKSSPLIGLQVVARDVASGPLIHHFHHLDISLFSSRWLIFFSLAILFFPPSQLRALF